MINSLTNIGSIYNTLINTLISEAELPS